MTFNFSFRFNAKKRLMSTLWAMVFSTLLLDDVKSQVDAKKDAINSKIMPNIRMNSDVEKL